MVEALAKSYISRAILALENLNFLEMTQLCVKTIKRLFSTSSPLHSCVSPPSRALLGLTLRVPCASLVLASCMPPLPGASSAYQQSSPEKCKPQRRLQRERSETKNFGYKFADILPEAPKTNSSTLWSHVVLKTDLPPWETLNTLTYSLNTDLLFIL